MQDNALRGYENFIGFFSEFANKVVELEQMSVVCSQVPHPVFNAIFPSRTKFDLDLANEAISILRDYSASFCYWQLTASEHVVASKPAVDFSLERQSPFVGFYLSKKDYVSSNVAALPSEFKVVSVSCVDQVDEWFRLIREIFQFDGSSAGVLISLYKEKLGQENLKHFVICDHEQRAIASCTIYINGNTAGLYNLCVDPSYRNQGIGSMLQHFRIKFAFDCGCDVVTLQASQMAKGIDRKIGFKEYGILNPYIHTAEV